MRPLSAQPRRRMSFGQLAAIPENRSLLTRNVERHHQQRQNRNSQGVNPSAGGKNSSPLHKSRNGVLRRSFGKDDLGEEVTVRADDVRYVSCPLIPTILIHPLILVLPLILTHLVSY